MEGLAMLRELITINPRTTARQNPRGKHRSGGKRKHKVHYKRNPRFGLPKLKDLTGVAVPALIGGVAALGLDIGIGQISMIPPEWKTGTKRTLLHAGLIFGLGFAARQFLPAKWRTMADQATAGALTITAYDGIKGFVTQQWPDLALGMYDGDLSAYETTGYSALPTMQRLRANGGSLSAYMPAGQASGGTGLHGIPVTR
jgi:hypothetical protein